MSQPLPLWRYALAATGYLQQNKEYPSPIQSGDRQQIYDSQINTEYGSDNPDLVEVAKNIYLLKESGK